MAGTNDVLERLAAWGFVQSGIDEIRLHRKVDDRTVVLLEGDRFTTWTPTTPTRVLWYEQLEVLKLEPLVAAPMQRVRVRPSAEDREGLMAKLEATRAELARLEASLEVRADQGFGPEPGRAEREHGGRLLVVFADGGRSWCDHWEPAVAVDLEQLERLEQLRAKVDRLEHDLELHDFAQDLEGAELDAHQLLLEAREDVNQWASEGHEQMLERVARKLGLTPGEGGEDA